MTSGMLDLYLSTVSNKMNEVMKVLTIFAAIFIPLTFIAGVYGMNFEFMPELAWGLGYPVWWVVGITLTVGMFIYFRKKRWLQFYLFTRIIMQKKQYSEEEAKEVALKIGINWEHVHFDLQQFLVGMNVEAEHGANDPETNVTNDDPILTGKIAWAHLKEMSDYYDRLAIMEKEADI